MTSKRLHWGLLSTARINRAIIPRLQDGDRHELVAIGSRSGEAACAYAREWNIPHACATYDTLLERDDVDAVYIGLPNALHAEWIVRAVEAGKHVLCEKPLVVSIDEWERVRDAAARHGRVVAEAFMYRHHPVVDFVTRLVDERRIGGLRSAHGTFAFWLSRDPDVRLDPELAGGSLWDVGCYPVSYLVHVAGAAPARVVAWQEMGRTGVDVSTHALLEFDRGFVAHVESGFRTPLRTSIELVGDEAVLRVPQPFRPQPRASVALVHDETPQTFEVDGPEPFQGEVDDLAGTVLDGLPQRLTLEESGAYLATLVAIQRSAREGRAVEVACAGTAASWRRHGGDRA